MFAVGMFIQLGSILPSAQGFTIQLCARRATDNEKESLGVSTAEVTPRKKLLGNTFPEGSFVRARGHPPPCLEA